jgi:hypothetical protein
MVGKIPSFFHGVDYVLLSDIPVNQLFIKNLNRQQPWPRFIEKVVNFLILHVVAPGPSGLDGDHRNETNPAAHPANHRIVSRPSAKRRDVNKNRHPSLHASHGGPMSGTHLDVLKCMFDVI